MRRASCVIAMGSLLALLSAEAFADKPRRGLQPYQDDNTEVRDLNRRPSKVRAWVEHDEPEENFEFPWKQLLGVVVCFAVAAPFAWKLYQHVNGEIASSKEDAAGQSPVRVRRKLPNRPS